MGEKLTNGVEETEMEKLVYKYSNLLLQRFKEEAENTKRELLQVLKLENII
jgi:hypothetical protein